MQIRRLSENLKKSRVGELLVTVLASASAAFGLVVILTIDDHRPSIDKTLLRDKLTTAITNDGGLRAVRHIYEQRERDALLTPTLWSYRRDQLTKPYYPLTDSLGMILEDLRTHLIMTKQPDKELIAKVEGVIQEHNAVNPFDRLDRNQRDHFNSIRQKLGEGYQIIKPDLEKVADEMVARNDLVTNYLADSTYSLRLTQIALFFAVALGAFQTYISWPTKQRKLIAEVFAKTEEVRQESCGPDEQRPFQA